METNYTHVSDAWIGAICSRASYLGQSKMGCRRSSRDAINGLVRLPFPRITLDFNVETGHYYCESKIQNPGCLTPL